MVKRTTRRKFIFLFISLFIIGFFIGYDYSILSSRNPGETSIEGSLINNEIKKPDSSHRRDAGEEKKTVDEEFGKP